VDDEFGERSGERGEVDVSKVVGSEGVPGFVVGRDDDVGCCFEDEETETEREEGKEGSQRRKEENKRDTSTHLKISAGFPKLPIIVSSAI